MIKQSGNKTTQLVILTGMSGSGKSTALNTFEDLGFYCVDNLPLPLLRDFLILNEKSSENSQRIALVMDVRARNFLDRHAEVFSSIKEEGFHLQVLFLDSSDDILIQRYSQTRRIHPLRDRGDLKSAISDERKMMLGLKAYADRLIDTSKMNVHQLRHTIIKLFAENRSLESMLIHIVSFGFKYGVPADANMVFDVRFLPNPYFEPELKPKSGQEKPVSDYVLQNSVSSDFLAHLQAMTEFLIPRFRDEGKAYLVFAIGCTGGRHRSVAVSEWLKNLLQKNGEEIVVTHRDMLREA